MDQPIENYSKLRLTDLKTALESNNFDVYLAENKQAACKTVLKEIMPNLNAATISWGGSLTFMSMGLYDVLKNAPEMNILDTYDKNIPHEDMLERRRQALLVDLFITGTNAVTESGMLVNLDMIGNRVAGLTFGPKFVVVLAGRNSDGFILQTFRNILDWN